MVNGRLIYTICRKLFYTICHLCIKNLHYHRRQAWTRLNNHLRGPYPYNGYPIFTHQPIGIWTSVNNYISCATYPVFRVQHITKTAVTTVVTTSYQVVKCWSTHTQLEIYFAANTTRTDLTSHHNFTCSIPPWFINIETATYNDYGARIPGATLWRTIEATGAT